MKRNNEIGMIIGAVFIYFISDLNTAIMCLIAWFIAYSYFEHCESKDRERLLSIGKSSRDRFDTDDEYDQWLDSLSARINNAND